MAQHRSPAIILNARAENIVISANIENRLYSITIKNDDPNEAFLLGAELDEKRIVSDIKVGGNWLGRKVISTWQ